VRFTPALLGRRVYTVTDRMAPTDGASFDVYVASCATAVRFGVRHERVRVVAP
jgi:3D (Asp-Asp-Asp) domain-containing protein